MAVGVERGRGEPGLMIWDINAIANSLPSPRPAENLASPIQTTSSRFSSRTPTSVENRDPRVTYQHGPAEAVNSMAFVPHSPFLLLAGLSQKTVRLLDTRNPSNNNVQQILHKAVFGLCVDPFDDTKFASYGDDFGIRFWDRRYFTQNPLLIFSEADASADGGKPSQIANIAFSTTRRGMLGSQAVDDSVVRMWSIIGGHIIGDEDSSLNNNAQRMHSRRPSLQARGLPKNLERPYETGDFFMPTIVHTKKSE